MKGSLPAQEGSAHLVVAKSVPLFLLEAILVPISVVKNSRMVHAKVFRNRRKRHSEVLRAVVHCGGSGADYALLPGGR